MAARTASPETLDAVLHALADTTRRDILARTMRRPSSVSAIARSYPMSFAAVQKHVAVLERAGLVAKQRRGREVLVRGRGEALAPLDALLDQFEQLWRTRHAAMAELLAEGTDDGTARSPHDRRTTRSTS